MSTIKEKIAELKEQMQQKRDELKLKIHLGKADAKDEWERLEVQRKELLKKADSIGDVIDEVTKDAGVALEKGFQELKDAYVAIRKKIVD